jgi:hypothetical protein
MAGVKEDQLHEPQAYLTRLIQYYDIRAFNAVTLPTCDVAMLLCRNRKPVQGS